MIYIFLTLFILSGAIYVTGCCKVGFRVMVTGGVLMISTGTLFLYELLKIIWRLLWQG